MTNKSNRTAEDNGISYAGFLQITNSILKPEFFHYLTGNEFKLLYYLTFLRWKFPKKEGRFCHAYIYLANGTGLSEPTVKKCMRSLARKQCLRLEGRKSHGNKFVVYSILLHDKTVIDQNDQSQTQNKNQIDQIDRSDRSKRSIVGSNSGTVIDQFDRQDNINTLLIDTAPRYRPNTSEGGQVDPSQRCPNGQNLRDGGADKGVHLRVDIIQEPLIGVAGLEAELQRRKREQETRGGW